MTPYASRFTLYGINFTLHGIDRYIAELMIMHYTLRTEVA